MVNQTVRGVVGVCGVAAMLLAAPAESRACGFLDCLFGWGGAARTTYMAPYVAPVAAPAVCNPCVAQSCRYLPQTCYRTVYQQVPVTTCQAVTTYRPVTTWTYRPRLVPYTTYRLVYSNPCVSYGVCDPCAGVPVTSSSVCGPAGCGVVSTPTVPYAGPSSSTTVPSSTAPKTFQQDSQPAEGGGLKPIPDTNTKLNSTPMPKLIDPDNRSTSRPVLQATYYRLVASPAKVVSSSGWRASSD